MIRHADFKQPVTIGLLAIAVVGFAIVGLLVFAICFTELTAASFLAATITAIAVATITAATDVENRPAAFGHTESLAKVNLAVPSNVPFHPHPTAGWTSGLPS